MQMVPLFFIYTFTHLFNKQICATKQAVFIKGGSQFPGGSEACVTVPRGL